MQQREKTDPVFQAPTLGGVLGRIIEASLTPAKCNAKRLRKTQDHFAQVVSTSPLCQTCPSKCFKRKSINHGIAV
jgi:hypothetical protein